MMAARVDVRVLMLILCFLFCGNVVSCPETFRNKMASFSKQRGLKIVHQNIRGLQSNFNLLCELVERNDFDIITLSETHLLNSSYNDNNSLFEIPNYTFIKRNRNNGKGGGVAVYIKTNLKWERRQDLETDSVECICLQIFEKNAKSFLVTVFYRPPSGSIYLSENFNELFSNLLATIDLTSLELILLGDANVNYAKKSENKDFKISLSIKGYKRALQKGSGTKGVPR